MQTPFGEVCESLFIYYSKHHLNFASLLAFCKVGEAVTFPEGSMKEYVVSLKNFAKDAGMRLAGRKQTVQLDLTENVTMRLDPKLIAGVATELLTNAIDFSPVGGSIFLRSKQEGRFATFEIEDHGCGIPKKDLSRIFDEFTRGSNATKYKADGNGLGLYIVGGIVKRSGGTISVKSEEGKGTKVTVRLPMA